MHKRIYGDLCLLRCNAREYAGHRESIERWKAWKSRIVVQTLALVLALSALAAAVRLCS